MRALTELDSARIACDLWRLARPGGGDDAEGLLPMKVVFRNAGRFADLKEDPDLPRPFDEALKKADFNR